VSIGTQEAVPSMYKRFDGLAGHVRWRRPVRPSRWHHVKEYLGGTHR
jgi:hypothetical protein